MKSNAKNTPMVALGPADVAVSGTAAKHLQNTIRQIAEDILAAGLRAVNVPVGQANATKEAFQGAGWKVEIHKCNGLLAELRFVGPDDPPIKEPTPLDLVIEARKALAETLAMIPVPRP